VYVNNSTKLKWKCSEGNVWEAMYLNVSNKKSWCPKCAIKRNKYSLSDCQLSAQKNNGKCLSDRYIHSKIKMKWRCEYGHIWRAVYDSILKGHWCPFCAGKAPHTIKDAQNLAEQYDGKCLSKYYKNSKHKLKWQCRDGHTWSARYDTVLSGVWCTKCSGYCKKTLSDARRLAKQHGGKCLSRKFVNTRTKIRWQCENGHIFKASYNSVNAKHWCPQCKYKMQDKLFKIISNIFKNCEVSFNFTEFKWLGRQEIDIFVHGVKLAIEYDGKQHFKPIEFFGGEKQFLNLKRLDKMKDEKIKSNSHDVKYFVRFNYKDKITIKNVINKLIKNGIPIN